MKRPCKMIFVKNRRRALWRGFLLALAVLPFGGCAVGPKYHPPVVPAPPAYKELGNWKPAQPNDQNLGGEWWKIFQDPQLDALELQVNVSNQNLKAAAAQYRQARAVLRYYRADYYPTVTAGPSATRTRVSANAPTNSALRGTTFNDFVMPIDVSYQADVWGRVRKNVESYREQAQASAADLATVNLSMHADLAIDYFQARSLDAQEQLLNSTVKQYEQALELNQSRFEEELLRKWMLSRRRLNCKLPAQRRSMWACCERNTNTQLQFLSENLPAEFSLPPLPLTAPPPRIPVSVPSELLERRPDIAAAERRVASANAQIGVAKSAYYPLISLTGSGGFESSSITTLVQGPSGLWSVGLSAVGTIFDVGRRRAFTDEARAAYDAQVAAYRENVLTGFQQVEDSLAAVRILENEADVQDEAVVAAQRSLDLSITRYKGGVTTYLEVITAQSAALSDQVTAVDILGRRMANTVLLIQALGGGWEKSSLPERPECCGKLVSSNAN